MEQFTIPRSIEEAKAIQKDLRRRLDDAPAALTGIPSLIAGMDVSYGSGSAYAAIVMMDFSGLSFHVRVEAQSPVRYPYIPGYFAFREIPALLEAWQLLHLMPGVLLVHGHGYAHPERVGLARHLGAFLKVPSIGVAGSILRGMRISEPPASRGEATPILMDGGVVGMVLRTVEGKNPVCVSAGYRTTLELAREVVLRCCRESRFPLPLVQADKAARSMRIRCEG